jgi:hypothetical protein
MVSGEIELCLRMTSPVHSVVLSNRDRPEIQQAAADAFDLALQQIREESFLPRPELGALLPEAATLADPAAFGRTAFAASEIREGSAGPWYTVALTAQAAALGALLLCFAWMFFRSVISGYLDRTFSRLSNGRCPDCEYDLRSGGLTICPECGKDADATLAEAREIAEAISHRPPPRLDRSNEPPTG